VMLELGNHGRNGTPLADGKSQSDYLMVNLDCSVVFATTRVPRGGPGASLDCLTGKPDGLTMSRGADLIGRDHNGGIFPGYEFIGIPYNDWGCESPFVADVLDVDIMLHTSPTNVLIS
jgi:hypothetical protein